MAYYNRHSNNLRTEDFSDSLTEYLRSRGSPADLYEISAHFKRDFQTIRGYIHDYLDLEEGPVCIVGHRSKVRLFGLRGTPDAEAVLRGSLRRSKILDLLTERGPTQLEVVARDLGISHLDIRKSIQSGPPDMFCVDRRRLPPTRAVVMVLSLPKDPRSSSEPLRIHVRKPKAVTDPDDSQESTAKGFARQVVRIDVPDIPVELSSTGPFEQMVNTLSKNRVSLSKMKLARDRKPVILDLI